MKGECEMIYTCEGCGAWFSGDLLRKAIENNDPVITCPYCGATTQFSKVQESRIAKGYDFLSVGEFGNAMSMFKSAIAEAKRHQKSPSPDAYLGCALCDFSIRTVFDEADVNKLDPPQFIFHTARDIKIDFTQSEHYKNALNSLSGDMDQSVYTEESARIRQYANTIDTFFDHYRAIARERNNENYHVFIAYEDDPLDEASKMGYPFAIRVRNNLPDAINNIFLPEIENYNNDLLLYEAAILYAIEHSNCMLVIADNNIDLRLTNIYTRYYYNHGYNGKQLGFIRYLDKIPIALRDNQAADNVFDYDDNGGDDYCEFVCVNNRIVYSRGQSSSGVSETVTDVVIPELPEMDEKMTDGDLKGSYKALPGGQFAFGSYPQRRVMEEDVIAHFNEYEKPSPLDSKGWQPMFFSKKTGRPTTWCRDEAYNGKKYRAVYFTRPREPYSVQPSDSTPREQLQQGYTPSVVYVFAFAPLIWNSIEQSLWRATLCANQGIDSREFNRFDMTSDWESSSIRAWLNQDFLMTAFSEEEREALFTLQDGEDKVFLIDKDADWNKVKKSRRAVLGSDYFKCIGGMCRDYGVNAYWILADDENKSYQEAAVVYPAMNGQISSQYVDNTVVAVVPKIILNL